MRQRIEQTAEHDIEDGKDQRVEHEPDDGERGEIVPSLGDLVGRLADDDDRIGVFERDHPHRAADKLRPNQRREPARHIILVGRIGGLPRRQDGELAARVHEHDAHVAKMFELEGQFFFELADPALRGEVFQGGGDETLGHFEGGFDLDLGGGAGVENGDGASQERGEKIDQFPPR